MPLSKITSSLNQLFYLCARDHDSEVTYSHLVRGVAAYNQMPSLGRQFLQLGFEDEKSFRDLTYRLKIPQGESGKGRVLWVGAHGNENGLLCRDRLVVSADKVVKSIDHLANSFELIIMDNCRSDRMFTKGYPKGCILITSSRDTDWHSSFMIYAKIMEWLFDDTSKTRLNLSAPDRLMHGLKKDWPRKPNENAILIQGIHNIIDSLDIKIIIDGKAVNEI